MNNQYDLFLESLESEHQRIIKEIANWDNPHKKYLDKGTVSCDEAEMYERIPIKNAIKKLNTMFTDDEINRAIEHCCKIDGQSRQRKEFLNCVFNFLHSI